MHIKGVGETGTMSAGKEEGGSGMLRNELNVHFHPVFGIQLNTDNDLEGSPPPSCRQEIDGDG